MIREFKTVAWAHTANIYEVNLRQYTPEGTIAAFIPHLSRLKEMGVQTLWFMPLTPIAQKNKKGELGSYYACSDYVSVSPEFGTAEEFAHLVTLAHKMNFKVIIDWVANHTGWDHVWTKEFPEYYQVDPATGDFKMAHGMEDIIELDYTNPALRVAMINAMKFWITNFNIDGFRCDLAFWVKLDFWVQARKELEPIKHLFWLGEFDELEHGSYGEVFDASYSWTWMHATENFYKKNEPLELLVRLLKRYDDLGDNTMRVWFTSNHDENSWNGTEYEKYGPMAKPLAVFSCTWNGIPLVYSGQEIPNLKRILFFEKDDLEWLPENRLNDFYKKLLTLHANHPALRGVDPDVQTFRINTTNKELVFSYLRKKGRHEVFVLLNFSQENNLTVELIDERVSGKYLEVFSGESFDFTQVTKIEMDSWEFRVFVSA